MTQNVRHGPAMLAAGELSPFEPRSYLEGLISLIEGLTGARVLNLGKLALVRSKPRGLS